MTSGFSAMLLLLLTAGDVETHPAEKEKAETQALGTGTAEKGWLHCLILRGSTPLGKKL
jgi:hypothetical protein